MDDYWNNRLFKAGAIIGLVGCGPLLAVILLAAIGLWPDPDPNPIGLGLLFMVAFWPAVVCMGLGAYDVRRNRR